MSSTLHDKIMSYNPEYCITMNQVYTLPYPMIVGTSSSTITNPQTGLQSATSYPCVFKPGIGPNGGAGSWEFKYVSGAIGSNWRTTSSSVPSTWMDGDWSCGFWIRFTEMPTGPNFIQLLAPYPINTSVGIQLYIMGSANASAPSKWAWNFNSSIVFTNSGPTLNQWHYVHMERKPYTAFNVNNCKLYVDGVLVASAVSSSVNTATTNSLRVGDTTSSHGSNATFNVCNVYIGPTANFPESAIQEIYTTGMAATDSQPSTGWQTRINGLSPVIWFMFDSPTLDTTKALSSGDFGNAISSTASLKQGIAQFVSVSLANSPNGITVNSGGPSGRYLSFPYGNDSVNGRSYISIFTDYQYGFPWSDPKVFSIEFWFRRNGYVSGNSTTPMPLTIRNSNNTHRVSFIVPQFGQANQGKIQAIVGGSSGTASFVSTQDVIDGNWHHAVLTVNTTTQKFYLDGALVGTQTNNLGSLFLENIRIGGNANNTEPWIGDLDEVVIYQTVLSDADILANYQAGQVGATTAPLKYWNGSAWVAPISMKQWNGSSWVTMDGEVYTSTGWLPIV